MNLSQMGKANLGLREFNNNYLDHTDGLKEIQDDYHTRMPDRSGMDKN